MRLRAFALLAFAAACDSSTGPEPVASISISAPATSLLEGQQLQLTASTLAADGSQLAGREVTWSSNNNAIATVSGTGLVSAVAAGSVRITALSEGIQSEIELTIARAAGLAVIFPLNPRLYAGTQLQLSITVRDRSGNLMTPGPITWTTSDASKIAVSDAGSITAGDAAPASAEIRASVSGVTTLVTPRVVKITSIALGDYHGCSLETSSEVYCWGRNLNGELGIGSERTDSVLIPTRITGGLSFTKLTAQGSHTCALTASGAAYCWGLNSDGQIGDGTRTNRRAPTAVSGARSFVEITAGSNHTCALTSDAEIYCWGNGVLIPTKVETSLKLHGLTAGLAFTCGLDAGGAAYCWGVNNRGELGNIDAPFFASPYPVIGDHKFSMLDAGWSGACGITTDHETWCWGSLRWNLYQTRSYPERVPGMPQVQNLSLSMSHLCALDMSGQAWCIGQEGDGELGRGGPLGIFTTTSAAQVAVAPGNVTVYDSISVGWASSCAITPRGVPFCWSVGVRIGVGGDGGVQRTPVMQALPVVP